MSNLKEICGICEFFDTDDCEYEDIKFTEKDICEDFEINISEAVYAGIVLLKKRAIPNAEVIGSMIKAGWDRKKIKATLKKRKIPMVVYSELQDLGFIEYFEKIKESKTEDGDGKIKESKTGDGDGKIITDLKVKFKEYSYVNKDLRKKIDNLNKKLKKYENENEDESKLKLKNTPKIENRNLEKPLEITVKAPLIDIWKNIYEFRLFRSKLLKVIRSKGFKSGITRESFYKSVKKLRFLDTENPIGFKDMLKDLYPTCVLEVKDKEVIIYF